MSEEARKKPVDKNALAQIPVLPIEKKHCKINPRGDYELPTCSVCLTDFALGEKAMFVPCAHIFHPECLKTWFEENNTCPVCRYELPIAEEAKEQNTM